MSPVAGSSSVWAAVTALAMLAASFPLRRPRVPPRRTPSVTTADGGSARRGSRPSRGPIRRPGRRRVPGGTASAMALWCDEVARSIRSGASLAVAVGDAAPPDPDLVGRDSIDALHEIAAALRRGRGVPPIPVASPDVALVIGVVGACADHGGPAAEPIDRAANVLRGRADEAAERATQSAPARLSAQVMTWLPVLMLALLLVSSASVRRAVATPVGTVAIALGVTLNLAGRRWLARLIRRAAA